MICNPCQGTGFINTHQIPADVFQDKTADEQEIIQNWIAKNKDHDVQVCDCCGDGEDWYGEPGQHYGDDDPLGDQGPYAYNGGLCECN